MLRFLKRSTLAVAKGLGAFHLVSATNWRRQRLLILCYHGVSFSDEHLWRPGMYMSPEMFRRRMQALARERCSVVSLQAGLKGLYSGNLPRKSVAITFDDGFVDFCDVALPILSEYGYTATVYQTTYYSEHRFPIFNLMLSYLFWRGQAKSLGGGMTGVNGAFDLGTEAGRGRAVDACMRFSAEKGLSASQKDELAREIAGRLGVDYEDLRRRGILQLMGPEQLERISSAGISVELHTHRHRTPADRELFLKEIEDNGEAIRRYTGKRPTHFCYPSGVYRDAFIAWLREEGLASATTCDLGIASPQDDPLRLPRLLDSVTVSDHDFEGWLAGFSALLPHRNLNGKTD